MGATNGAGTAYNTIRNTWAHLWFSGIRVS